MKTTVVDDRSQMDVESFFCRGEMLYVCTIFLRIGCRVGRRGADFESCQKYKPLNWTRWIPGTVDGRLQEKTSTASLPPFKKDLVPDLWEIIWSSCFTASTVY